MKIRLIDKLIGLLIAFAVHAIIGLSFLGSAPIDGAAAVGEGGISVGLGMAGAYADAAEQTVDTTEAKKEPVVKPVTEDVPPTPLPKIQPELQTKTEKNTTQPDIAVERKVIDTKPRPPVATMESVKATESVESKKSVTNEKVVTDSKPTENANTSSEAMKKANGRSDSRQSGGRAGDIQGYFAQLMSWLNQHKNYPAELKKDKRQGTVVIKFTMNHDGQVIRSKVEKTSGIIELDAAALNMLSSASPLPPIPTEMNRQQLTLAIPVDYSLRTK